LITIGAINYFGFFNPSSMRTTACSFPQGFHCDDFIINEADPGGGEAPYLRMILVNEYGVNVTINGITMTSKQFDGSQDCTLDPDVSLGVGNNATVWCPVPEAAFTPGEFYEGAVTILFNQTGGSYEHTTAGRYALRSQ
jgi:hypothetical protein